MDGVQGNQNTQDIAALEAMGNEAISSDDMSLIDKVMMLFLEAAESKKEDIERKMEGITGMQEGADNIKSALNSLNEVLGQFDAGDPEDKQKIEDVTFTLTDGTEANAQDYLEGLGYELDDKVTKDELSGAISTLENELDGDNGVRETDMMKLQFSLGEYNRVISMATNIEKKVQEMQGGVTRNMG